LGGDRLKLPGLGVVTVNDLQRRLMAPIAKMVRAMAVEGSPALDRKIEKIAIAERGKLIKADGHNLAQLRKTDPDLIDSYTAKVDLAACRKQALDYFASPGAFRLVQRDGLWYLQISAELPSQVTATSKEVGIDTGTALLVDGTNGLSIKHDCYSDAEDRLSRIDRALSDQVYGSSNYNKLLAKKRKIEGELQRNRKARQAYFASQIADVNGVIKIKKIELPDTLGLPIPIPDGKGGYKANGAGKAKERNRTILDRATGQFIALVEQQCKKRGRNFERVKVESIAPPEKLLGLDSGKKSKAKTPKTIGTKRNRKYEKRVG
jgi:hypothetical protein